MMVRTAVCPASRTFIYAVVSADIAYSGAQFEIPSLAKHPLVAVAYAGTVIPSFMSFTAAVPEKIERGMDIPHVEFAPVKMKAEEVTVEFFA